MMYFMKTSFAVAAICSGAAAEGQREQVNHRRIICSGDGGETRVFSKKQFVPSKAKRSVVYIKPYVDELDGATTEELRQEQERESEAERNRKAACEAERKRRARLAANRKAQVAALPKARLAQKTGLSTRDLRAYEDMGLDWSELELVFGN